MISKGSLSVDIVGLFIHTPGRDVSTGEENPKSTYQRSTYSYLRVTVLERARGILDRDNFRALNPSA